MVEWTYIVNLVGDKEWKLIRTHFYKYIQMARKLISWFSFTKRKETEIYIILSGNCVKSNENPEQKKVGYLVFENLLNKSKFKPETSLPIKKLHKKKLWKEPCLRMHSILRMHSSIYTYAANDMHHFLCVLFSRFVFWMHNLLNV